MHIEQKNQIITAANEYAGQKELSNAQLSKFTGINAGYISQMLRGIYTTNAGGKAVDISDKYFKRLAECIGFKIEKDYWELETTTQFMEIISHLETAKEEGTSGMIIGPTGCGKTYTVDKFIKKNPHNTYRITVSKLHTLNQIMEELLEIMNLQEKGRAASKMSRIVRHLKDLKREGENVMIIIDEAENLRAPVFGMVKAMYDGVVDFASIILIGTEELTDKMERQKRRNKDGMPQFCRRFKAGTMILTRIDSMDIFLDKHVKENGLKALLKRLCENYGELHDYLVPAMKEADRKAVPLTEEFFRIKYNLPKYK